MTSYAVTGKHLPNKVLNPRRVVNMLLCIDQFAVLYYYSTSASHFAGVVMCDSNSHGRMCNVAQSKIAPAHAEPAQEKSVIYRKNHELARTLPLIDGGGLAGRLHLVPQSVQVGVFGRSLAAS